MTLSELFGKSVLVTTLDFLLENRFWDYSKIDIATNTGQSRQSIYKIWPTLEKFEIITPSKKIRGKMRYKTNQDSTIVKNLSKLSLSIMNMKEGDKVK